MSSLPPADKTSLKKTPDYEISSPAGRRNKRRFRKGSRVRILAEVKEFCEANLGVPLLIGGPGARGDIEGVHGLYAPESEVECFADMRRHRRMKTSCRKI